MMYAADTHTLQCARCVSKTLSVCEQNPIGAQLQLTYKAARRYSSVCIKDLGPETSVLVTRL